MHLHSVLNLVLFVMSITATCVQTENPAEKSPTNKISKRITKREAAVIIEHYPLDTTISKKPQVIIRRISKHKGPKSKAKYYRHAKRARPGKYTKSGKKTGPTILNRIPATWTPYKKNKKPFYSYKHGSARVPFIKPVKLGPQSRYKSKHKSKPSKKPHIYNPPRPVGFGEPPLKFSHFKDPSQESEPPVDLYGAPLAAPAPPPAPPGEPYPLDGTPELDYDMPSDVDSRFAYSNIHAKVVNPDVNAFDNPVLMDLNENNIGAYPNVFNLHKKKQNQFIQLNKNRPIVDDFDVHVRELSREDQEIVGGQYAEPPARVVPKSRLTYQFEDDDFLFSPVDGFANPKLAPSANISPYVNYKNSNIAFSPQNLNDAFSIVD